MRWLFALAGIGLLFTSPAQAQFSPFGSPFWEPQPRPGHAQRKARKPKQHHSSRQGKGKLRSWEANGGARPAIKAQSPKTVSFPYGQYEPGSVVVDTKSRKLYYVLDDYQAYQYPISVGRHGFTWTGEETITRVQAWPDWHPPQEMRERDRRLPEKMTGGLRNPLGAKAIYLGDTLYRIHGTNDTKSIGRAASSGCFRMRNGHVVHLASTIQLGARVYVLDKLPKPTLVRWSRPRDEAMLPHETMPDAPTNEQMADAPGSEVR
jgi:lipoprotein-anchoring transpeptidase ErfK/SrfK